jgi:hypothetical protein
MRPTRLLTKLTAGAACALALAVTLSAAPARAEDDEPSIDQKLIRGLMEGLGLQRDGEAINYQERAPLVIPPGRDLPPPENPDAAIAKNPAWPKDPDVMRRREEARLAKNRNISEERELEQNPLRPDQLTPGRASAPRRTTNNNDSYRAATGDFQNPLSPSELGYKGGIFGSMFGGGKDDEVAKFTGEPTRSSLTEPPPGYQTPSPDQPYGAGKGAAPKAEKYYESHGEPTR